MKYQIGDTVEVVDDVSLLYRRNGKVMYRHIRNGVPTYLIGFNSRRGGRRSILFSECQLKKIKSGSKQRFFSFMD